MWRLLRPSVSSNSAASSAESIIRRPLGLDLLKDRRGDFLDRLVRGGQPLDAFALHHALGFVDLVAAIFKRGVLAAGPALVSNLREPLRVDRQTEHLVAMFQKRRR